MIKVIKQELDGSYFILSVGDLCFPVEQVESGGGQQIQGIFGFFSHLEDSLVILFGFRFLFLFRGSFLLFGSFFFGGSLFFVSLFGSSGLLGNSQLLNGFQGSFAEENSSPHGFEGILVGHEFKPSLDIIKFFSEGSAEAESEGEHQGAHEGEVRDGDLVSDHESSGFEVGVEESEGLSDVAEGSFVHVGVESSDSEHGEEHLADGGLEFQGAPVKPLVDLGVFNQTVSVESLTLAGEVSQDGVRLEERSFGSFEHRGFAVGAQG